MRDSFSFFRRHPLACAVLSALPLLANASDQATTLDRVEVTASRSPLDARASGGTRLDVSLQDTPASVTIIDRELLDARGVRTTQEALSGIPGLSVASPPGNGNAVTWRGFSGSQVSQLFNGIDVQYATIAARPVDAWMYERVEAIGGPSSFLYGAGAVGGAINYVTRLAQLDGNRTDAMASVGSFDSTTFAIGSNQRLGGEDASNALRVDASFSRTHGWVDRNDREALTTAASLLSRFSPALTHTLALEYQQEDSARPYWGTPAQVDGGGRLRVLPGTQGRNYNVRDGYYQQDVLWARSLLEWQVDEKNTLRNTAYYYDALRDYRNVESYRFNTDASAVIRSGALLQRHDQQVQGDKLEWSYDGQLGGLRSQWNAGVDISYNRQTRFPLSLAGPNDQVPIDAVTPGSFFDVPGAAQVFNPQRTNRLHTQALFVENLTGLGRRFSLMTGLRHDRIHLDLENHQAASAGNPARYDIHYSPTTGRAALNFAITPAASLYLQYATAADPPAGILSTASYANLQDFDLSTGRQVELGSKLQRADGRAFATMAAYRIVRDNLAITDPDNPGQTLPVGRQSSRGIEATFGFRPWDALSIEGNLGWVDARLDEFVENVGGVAVSRAGNTPSNTPSRVGNLWVDYAFNPQWSAGIDLRSMSSRDANTANTVGSAGYTLLGAHVDWRLEDGWLISLRGRNLDDRIYVAYALGTSMVYLGEPRSMELSVRKGF